MTTTLYGLKTCDTCRKALKALDGAATFHDVRADGVTKAQIEKWARAAGWEKLLNTRSTTWRELPPAAKENVDERAATRLMLEHPTLIKRPVIEHEGDVFIGWTKDTQAALGL